MPVNDTPLWICPRCGHQFVTANLWHSCGQFELNDHFRGRDPEVRAVFDRLVELISANGPVTVYAQKTRIVCMVRVRFAGMVVHKHSLDLGLWLTRQVEHPLLLRTEVFGPRSFGLHFRLSALEQIDAELVGLLNEAYKTGLREHLRR